MAQVDDRLERVLPLVHQLDRFCRHHEQGEREAAVAPMLAFVRRCWPDIPTADPYADENSKPPAPAMTPDELLLHIIAAIGEMAGNLGELLDYEIELAWSRAVLVVNLERYEQAVDEGPPAASGDG